jgi:hypothetical protein
MKITHTKDWKEHRVAITDESTWGDHEREVRLIGRGKTKHEAIQSALEAVKSVESALETFRKELGEL